MARRSLDYVCTVIMTVIVRIMVVITIMRIMMATVLILITMAMIIIIHAWTCDLVHDLVRTLCNLVRTLCRSTLTPYWAHRPPGRHWTLCATLCAPCARVGMGQGRKIARYKIRQGQEKTCIYKNN